MFQTPAGPSVQGATAVPEPVSVVPEPASQSIEAGAPVKPRLFLGLSRGLIVTIIVVFSAVAVFVFLRKLY
jgi:hypothetical protein